MGWISSRDFGEARVFIDRIQSTSRFEAPIEDDTPETDGELVAAARNGDLKAWQVLYTRWLPWVWRYAYSLVHDVHVAEDVTSEAMMVWVQRFNETSQDVGQLAAWLRQVVHHKAVDYHRHGERYRRALEGFVRRERDVNHVLDSHGSSTSPELLELGDALARLNESQRLLLEWKYGDGLSVRKIAERLGVSEKAIEAKLYRARDEVRQWISSRETFRQDSAITKADPSGQASQPRSGTTL